MPALDKCHPIMVRALQNDHWWPESKSPRLSVEDRTVIIDIRARRDDNGTNQQILMVEVKCFPDEDTITTETYTALGQYIVYRGMLEALGDTTPLYLAVPESICQTVFDIVIMKIVRDYQIKIIVVSLEQEKIVQWIE